MTADLEHDEVAELLGAYALNAVDPDEGSLVERHLAECPRCRTEVDALRQVGADLALLHGLDREHPPPGLWDRIAADISAPEPSVAPAAPTAPEPVRREALPARRRSRPIRRPQRRRLGWLGGVVAGAAAAAIVALAVAVVHTEGQVHDLRSALAGRGPQAAVRAALASPGHQVVDLRSGTGTQLAEVVLRHDGVGFVVHSTMSRLPSTETYQLWASINGRPISLGLLGRQPARGSAFTLGTAATRARELMVTVEPAGGVPKPDRTPLATAPLALT